MQKDNQYLFLETCIGRALEEVRHRLDITYTGNPDIDRGIRAAIGYYIRAKVRCSDICPPDATEYVSCLSTDFAHGVLIKARAAGYLPQYNKKKAEKYHISARCSLPSF